MAHYRNLHSVEIPFECPLTLEMKISPFFSRVSGEQRETFEIIATPPARGEAEWTRHGTAVTNHLRPMPL